MDSIGHIFCRFRTSLAIALAILVISGCSTGVTGNVSAPHSTVSRDTALSLAKQFATRIGGRAYVIAPSGSMLPTLDEGSIVTIEKVALEKLKVGDIIVYRNAAGLAVIHRLYERHNDLWFVLGDNNVSVDRETVSAENLLGRVCAIFYTATDKQSANAQLTAVASRQ